MRPAIDRSRALPKNLLRTEKSDPTLMDVCVLTMSTRALTPLIMKQVIQILGIGGPPNERRPPWKIQFLTISEIQTD